MQEQRPGHVYLLVSENSQFVKIGGTEFPPLKRIREINLCEPYRSLGPWTLHDFRQVADWRKVESFLHYAFRGSLAAIDGAKELFAAAPHMVSQKLLEIEPEQLIGRPKIDRMFNDAECAGYIERLFAFTGLLRWLDIQGAWTFVLFPGTSRGRYFTINIGPHEVAYTRLPQRHSRLPMHMVVMDRLIYDFPDARSWVDAHAGEFIDDKFATALPRSVTIKFHSSFENARAFFRLDGVRRALIAYWSEALLKLHEKGAQSVYARFHNWNAIAELRLRAAREQSGLFVDNPA